MGQSSPSSIERRRGKLRRPSTWQRRWRSLVHRSADRRRSPGQFHSRPRSSEDGDAPSDAMSEHATLEEFVCPAPISRDWIIPGDRELIGAEVSWGSRAVSSAQGSARASRGLPARSDRLPSSLGLLTVNALAAADAVLIQSVRISGARRNLSAHRYARKGPRILNPELEVAGVDDDV
jgi:hypothetical protein